MSTAQVADPAPVDSGLEKKLENVKLDGNQTPSQTQASSVSPSLKDKPVGPRKLPIFEPPASIEIPAAPVLTTEQQSKYDQLLEEVKTWKEVPAADGKGGAITDSEIQWLTRECLLRYLRATKWVVAEASTRLLGTLTWRRDYGVEGLTADHVSPEGETGKEILLGYDNNGRPCHYLNPGRQNTNASPRQVQHLVFMLERVIELGIPGQEALALLINFKTSKSRSYTAPGIGQGREVLNILQTHYPERLGRALIINVPFLVWGFFKLITPFIDPLTREKLKFNDNMRQYVPPEQLWTEFHGDLDFEYEHETYWPALIQKCTEIRATQKERWIKGGKLFGESEAYLKGGNSPSVGQSSSTAVPDTRAQEAVPATPKQETLIVKDETVA